MDISCAFPTTMDTPEMIRVAEEIGYARTWIYDTPQQSPDVWMVLAMAAERTSRIELGPGVLVPSLRHPMVNAAATATLVALAPGRVNIAFGTGFSGRRAMGYRAITWAFMEDYIEAYKGLLRGDVVTWEGARMQMLHPADHGAPRPIEVPIILSAFGPKGTAIARETADGVFIVGLMHEPVEGFPWVSYLCSGTVLDEGEPLDSARVKAAAGPGTAQAWHGTYELQTPADVAALPGGPQWLEVVDRTPLEERHLAVHVQHLVGLNEADEAAWAAGGSELATSVTLTGTAKEVGARVAALADIGVTEVSYQPSGPDVTRELERFYAAATA